MDTHGHTERKSPFRLTQEDVQSSDRQAFMRWNRKRTGMTVEVDGGHN